MPKLRELIKIEQTPYPEWWDDEEHVYQVMKRLFYYQQLAIKWCRARLSHGRDHPGEKWESMIRKIIRAMIKYYPPFFIPNDDGDPVTVDAVMKTLRITDAKSADEAIDVIVDSFNDFYNHGREHLVSRVIKDCKNNTMYEVASVIQDRIDELGVDLIAANELSDSLKMSSHRIGLCLKLLGHERHRITGSGSIQWVWAVDNHEKYRDMRKREIMSRWKAQFEPISFSQIP